MLQKLRVTGLLTIVLAAADPTQRPHSIDLVDELVLHKNAQARNNICTLRDKVTLLFAEN